jgi:hypothetical protein
MRSSIARRPLAVLACILQLVLGGAGGFADAWLESTSAGPLAAHVEETGTSCPPAHTEDCVVCRQLTAVYGAPEAASPCPIVEGQAVRVAPKADRAPSSRLARTLLPRAPPLA